MSEARLSRNAILVRGVLSAAAVLALSAGALAQAEKPQAGQPQVRKPEAAEPKPLLVGDKAPALQVEKWVKGETITGFEKGKVYVVEFWATWCGPCIASMPHLSDLQKEYKDKGVTIIGMTSKDPNNTLEGVEAMVESKGDTMGYHVAWDTERKTNEAYMKAARQRGIPTSFVVDQQGRVAYIGHPMTLDKPLEEIVAGTWDLAAAAAKFKADMAAEEAQMKAQRELNAAVEAEDWDKVTTLLRDLAKSNPDAKGPIAMQGYMMLLQAGQYDNAYAFGAEAMEAMKDNSQALNQIAWMIVDPEAPVEKQDLDLALRAAERANELTEGEEPAIVDTLAKVYWDRGEKSKAIELQEKAVKLAAGTPMEAELKARLEEYRKTPSGG